MRAAVTPEQKSKAAAGVGEAVEVVEGHPGSKTCGRRQEGQGHGGCMELS